MEPWMWKQMLWTVGFLGITYVPLQVVVLWKCRGAARVAAALPLLFMVPMIVAGLQPSAYRSGSLYGMFFFCPYLPAMIYLVAVASVGPRVPKLCPHCGHKTRVKSFQMTRSSKLCAKCGKDLLGNATTEADAAPIHGQQPRAIDRACDRQRFHNSQVDISWFKYRYSGTGMR